MFTITITVTPTLHRSFTLYLHKSLNLFFFLSQNRETNRAMASDSWASRFSTSSRRYQTRSGLFKIFHFFCNVLSLVRDGVWKLLFFWIFCWFVVLDLYDETKTDEDLKAKYLCPFCSEDFDVVGLFCHIDEEHPAEAKNGVLYSYRVLLMDVN